MTIKLAVILIRPESFGNVCNNLANELSTSKIASRGSAVAQTA
jgi:hypothetical protein